MKHVIIPIFIPHKGCPYDCIFCNQKVISGEKDEMSTERIRSIVDEHLDTVSSENIEIAFFGGSFTGIPKEEQISFLTTAKEYIDLGKIKSVRISTRPDYISDEILEYLKSFGVKMIELGVQSLDADVLLKSCRGHSAEDVYNACQLIRKHEIDFGIQTMIGLPEDNIQKDIQTALKVCELKPKIVRIYPALVIKNTYMEQLYINGIYKPYSIDETVQICSELLDIYESNNIDVIRVGLQPTESISENGDIVAGPFHPAIRQLVDSNRMLKRMSSKLESLSNKNQILIYCHPSNISNIAGHKRSNIEILKKNFDIKMIKVVSNAEIPLTDFEIVAI